MSEQPQSLVEAAVDAGLDAIAGALLGGGARTGRVIVMLQAEGVPGSEGDCTMAIQGIEDPNEVLEVIARNGQEYARAMGAMPAGPPPAQAPG